MVKPYHSIESVFERNSDTDNLLRFGEIREEISEVKLLKGWTLSEKIDGTNIRVTIRPRGIEVAGRTNKANVNPKLVEAVLDSFPGIERLHERFGMVDADPADETRHVTFYGEGYGPKIQKGGVYSDVMRFAAFDIRFGETWQDDDTMRGICRELGVPVVPLVARIGNFPTTQQDMFTLLPYSLVAEQNLGVTNVVPEGIVAKPHKVLLNKYGNRVMWKLTNREFTKAPRRSRKAVG